MNADLINDILTMYSYVTSKKCHQSSGARHILNTHTVFTLRNASEVSLGHEVDN